MPVKFCCTQRNLNWSTMPKGGKEGRGEGKNKTNQSSLVHNSSLHKVPKTAAFWFICLFIYYLNRWGGDWKVSQPTTTLIWPNSSACLCRKFFAVRTFPSFSSPPSPFWHKTVQFSRNRDESPARRWAGKFSVPSLLFFRPSFTSGCAAVTVVTVTCCLAHRRFLAAAIRYTPFCASCSATPSLCCRVC